MASNNAAGFGPEAASLILLLTELEGFDEVLVSYEIHGGAAADLLRARWFFGSGTWLKSGGG